MGKRVLLARRTTGGITTTLDRCAGIEASG